MDSLKSKISVGKPLRNGVAKPERLGVFGWVLGNRGENARERLENAGFSAGV